jgi:hypothetical protein
MIGTQIKAQHQMRETQRRCVYGVCDSHLLPLHHDSALLSQASDDAAQLKMQNANEMFQRQRAQGHD